MRVKLKETVAYQLVTEDGKTIPLEFVSRWNGMVELKNAQGCSIILSPDEKTRMEGFFSMFRDLDEPAETMATVIKASPDLVAEIGATKKNPC